MAGGAPDGPDVFLSYAGEDETRARELATALEQRGFSVFWDREIPPGQTWHSYIGEALANARCVVVAWSRHSIASQWVLEEASEGKDRNVLVPVLFETVQPPFGFRAIQGANLTDWRLGQSSPAFDSLLSAVRRILGAQALSRTEAEPEPPTRPQPPSGLAPKTKPSVRRATVSPARSDPRTYPVQSSYGQARAWSRRRVLATLVGFVVIAAAGGAAVLWWPTQPASTAPTGGPPASRSSIAEPEPSEPVVDTASSVAPDQPSAASAETDEPVEGMRDCEECPLMVLVPPGEFTMGSPPDEPGRDDDEGPQRTVTIAEPIWVSRDEVTFAEWDACVEAGECKEPHDAGWGRDSRPVIYVTWNDAKSYAYWLSQKTRMTYRLLSEAEWEYVARASSTTAFWWGQGIGSDNANCNGCGGGWGNTKTAPVGSFRANDFGLYDTAGNVWEWVEDCYHDNYEGAPTDDAPRLEGECTDRVLRGGAWNDEPKVVRSANRDRSNPDIDWRNDVGFRVARTAD